LTTTATQYIELAVKVVRFSIFVNVDEVYDSLNESGLA